MLYKAMVYAWWYVFGLWLHYARKAAVSVYWKSRRFEKRSANRLIVFLIRRYHWHTTILDTNIPNVAFLKVKHLTVVNGYGQEHVIR